MEVKVGEFKPIDIQPEAAYNYLTGKGNNTRESKAHVAYNDFSVKHIVMHKSEGAEKFAKRRKTTAEKGKKSSVQLQDESSEEEEAQLTSSDDERTHTDSSEEIPSANSHDDDQGEDKDEVGEDIDEDVRRINEQENLADKEDHLHQTHMHEGRKKMETDGTSTENAEREAKYDCEMYIEMWEEHMDERKEATRIGELVSGLKDKESSESLEMEVDKMVNDESLAVATEELTAEIADKTREQPKEKESDVQEEQPKEMESTIVTQKKLSKETESVAGEKEKRTSNDILAQTQREINLQRVLDSTSKRVSSDKGKAPMAEGRARTPDRKLTPEKTLNAFIKELEDTRSSQGYRLDAIAKEVMKKLSTFQEMLDKYLHLFFSEMASLDTYSLIWEENITQEVHELLSLRNLTSAIVGTSGANQDQNEEVPKEDGNGPNGVSSSSANPNPPPST
ncbi:protein starmaker-like [Rhodamnia argentea]|uniref:Protein starmaker-like n=1 Tax=Rhodamnia argentea TaxID=178133 RepID=A0ABM3HW26_9MYRT|nr:protein starmaker-like [Rhodamnia argentea]